MGRLAPAAFPLGLATVLFGWSLNFGLPFLFRPDEDVMVGRSVSMAAEGRLDPLFANYPPLVFYLFAAAERIAALFGLPTLVGPVRGDPSAAYMVARLVSAGAGVATVTFVFLAGRRAYGLRAGMVAATIVAAAPLAVRQYHFATTDGVQTALVAAAIWAGLRARGPVGFAAAGAISGLAAASKYTGGAVLVFVLVLAMTGVQPRRRAAWAAAGAAALAFAVPCLVMLAHPAEYARGALFIGGNLYSRGTDLPVGWIYFPTVALFLGLGAGAYLMTVAGVASALLRRTRVEWALLAFVLVYLGVTGSGHEVFFRYLLPVVPALALLAGWAPSRLAGAHLALVALLLLPSLYASVSTDRLLGTTDTRRQAADWIDANLPAGSTIRVSNYYVEPYYDRVMVEQNRRATGDALGAAFLQGRFTSRYRVGGSHADLDLSATGPPYQDACPSVGPAPVARFAAADGCHIPRFFYDRLDSFYIPFWDFDRIQRPGPTIELRR